MGGADICTSRKTLDLGCLGLSSSFIGEPSPRSWGFLQLYMWRSDQTPYVVSVGGVMHKTLVNYWTGEYKVINGEGVGGGTAYSLPLWKEARERSRATEPET